MTAGIINDTKPVTRALSSTRNSIAELITALRDGGLDHHDAPGKAQILDQVQELLVMMQAVDAEVLAGCRDGKVAEQECQRSMAKVLERRCLVGSGEAKRRVRAADAVGSRTSPSGLPLPPLRPRMAEAMTTGTINADQVRILCTTLDKLERTGLDPHQVETIEAELVQLCLRFGPKELENVCQRYLDVYDPDGPEPDEQRNHDRRFFDMNQTRSGAYVGQFRLTGATGAKLAAVLGPLAKPRLTNTGNGETSPAAVADLRSHGQRMHDALDDAFSRLLRTGDLPDSGGTPASVIITIDGTDLLGHLGRLPETFTTGCWVCPECGATGQPTANDDHQTGTGGATPNIGAHGQTAQDTTSPQVPDPTLRDEDAADARAGHDDQHQQDNRPATGHDGPTGEGPNVITGDEHVDDLENRSATDLAPPPHDSPGRVRRKRPRHGTTSDGTTLSIPELLRLANEADIYPVVMTQHGQLLDLGHSRRIANKQQTMALIARDGGCSFPGCDHPPEWCQRHHVISWSENGKTSVDNLTLLCSFHHHQFLLRGWTVRINKNGLPEWIPPRWIDPDQKPMINNRIIARIHQAALINEWDELAPDDHRGRRRVRPPT